MKEDEFRLYRGGSFRIGAWSEATYFVTWRLGHGQPDLTPAERDDVAEALRHFNATRYKLAGYVIMNDHVHVVVEPADGERLEAIVHSWKSFTAHRFARAGSRKAPCGKRSISTAFCEVNWKWPRSFNTCWKIRGGDGRRSEDYAWLWLAG